MKMEEKQVLLNNRFNIFKNRRYKEWWYTGVSDPSQNFYCSITFARIDLIDSLRIIIYNKDYTEPIDISWKGFLNSERPEGKLYLVYETEKIVISYTGSYETGWKFIFKKDDWDLYFNIKATTQPFTKFDNQFKDVYSLLHFFQNSVSGTVKIGSRTLEIKNALGYYDHCYGKVPRSTKWHWIAVHNNNFALDSLMNYGPYAQCYSECYIKENLDEKDLKRWIRLDQDVSFESVRDNRWDNFWYVTSPDMDIKLTILEKFEYRESIPPVIPFVIDVKHAECYVKAEGKIRIDGSWVETGEMFGVLEEHHGHW